eukprot:IDg933t1
MPCRLTAVNTERVDGNTFRRLGAEIRNSTSTETVRLSKVIPAERVCAQGGGDVLDQVVGQGRRERCFFVFRFVFVSPSPPVVR